MKAKEITILRVAEEQANAKKAAEQKAKDEQAARDLAENKAVERLNSRSQTLDGFGMLQVVK